MDAFDLEIKIEFINEALMNLEEAEGSFMELESAFEKMPLLDQIFRLAHNLKGGSQAVGFPDVSEFTHRLESLVLKIKKNEIALSPEVVTTLLRSNDRLIEMLSGLKADLTARFENVDLIADIEKWLTGQTKIEIHDVHVPAIPPADVFFTPEIIAPPVASLPMKQTVQAVANHPAKDDEIIRVNLAKINLLNDYAGELIVLQSVIKQQTAANETTQLQASMRQFEKLSKDIQSLSMGLRMLPVRPLVQKLQRVVRDTGRALNKEIHFEVVGDQMDIDKSVLDHLGDPLIHILRNAVDHGIESSSQNRTAAGKPAAGTITLMFSNEGNHLVVEARDDGKGIDVNVLRAKAIERNIISAPQDLTEKQLLNLIFHPGFSTKTETSEISGRGVGMDVVKTNVEKIGGHVEVVTELGVGSLFKLQIPLSLAVIDGLVVTSGKSRYVLPLSQVQETINLSSQKIFAGKLGIGSCFDLRGTVVPLIDIEEALGKKNIQIQTTHTGLIIDVGDSSVALVVENIVRAQQIVIKPLGNGIQAQTGWIGSCVLGDGLPALILNPVELLESKISYSTGGKSPGRVA